MGGGGGIPPGDQPLALPTHLKHVVTGMLGVDPTDGTSTSWDGFAYDLKAALDIAMSVNAWSGRSPYDPRTDIAVISDALEEFRSKAAGLSAQNDVEEYIESAAAKYDAKVNGSAKISELVSAHDDADEASYQRRVSGSNVGMWMQGAYMTTQFAVAGMLVAAQRGRDLALMRSTLEAQSLSARVSAITEMARMMLQENLASVQSAQAVVSNSYEAMRLKITAINDYDEQKIDYIVRRTTWNIAVLNDGQPIISSLFGVQPVPRALTKGERAVARLGTAVNTALQFGAATSPGAGILAGLGSLGIASIGDRLNA